MVVNGVVGRELGVANHRMLMNQLHRCPALPPIELMVRCRYAGRWVEWNRDGLRQMERVTACRYCEQGLS